MGIVIDGASGESVFTFETVVEVGLTEGERCELIPGMFVKVPGKGRVVASISVLIVGLESVRDKFPEGVNAVNVAEAGSTA